MCGYSTLKVCWQVNLLTWTAVSILLTKYHRKNSLQMKCIIRARKQILWMQVFTLFWHLKEQTYHFSTLNRHWPKVVIVCHCETNSWDKVTRLYTVSNLFSGISYFTVTNCHNQWLKCLFGLKKMQSQMVPTLQYYINIHMSTKFSTRLKEKHSMMKSVLTTTSTEFTWLLSSDVLSRENSCCKLMGCPADKLLPDDNVDAMPTVAMFALFGVGITEKERHVP